jgi:hypothetical protein
VKKCGRVQLILHISGKEVGVWARPAWKYGRVIFVNTRQITKIKYKTLSSTLGFNGFCFPATFELLLSIFFPSKLGRIVS